MTRLRFYVGTTDEQGGPFSHVAARAHLVSIFGGYTAFHAKGAWRSEDAVGPSIVYEVLTNNVEWEDTWSRANRVPDLARTLRDLCSQMCVLYTVETVQGAFV